MRLPPPLSWLWEGWKLFSHAFGRVMSFIILTILWIIGFGTYALILKISMLRHKENPNSNWTDLLPETEDHLLRQF